MMQFWQTNSSRGEMSAGVAWEGMDWKV